MIKKTSPHAESNPIDDSLITSSLSRTVEVLTSIYGTPRWERKDPLDELMVTLLSQNTHDRNRDKAYQQLRTRFQTWEDVLTADTADIEQVIHPAGLSRQKAARMKEILRWIKEHFGGMSLDRLKDLSDDEALTLLTSRKGIGIKTAAVVLAMALDRDLCPVDTHIHRIARRLGWIAPGVSADKAFWRLRRLIPPGCAAAFHLNLLKFGRNICLARKPACAICPLTVECVEADEKTV